MGKKPPNRKTLRNKCDKLFSLFIRQRDRVCQRCQHGPPSVLLQCAHIFSRRYLATRWDPDNAVALCQGCHVMFTHNPIAWEDWVIERMGEDAYRALRMKAASSTFKPDYESIIYRLEQALG